MQEIKKIIIKKQSYMFELRKKYFNKKKFKIIEKRLIDRMIDEIRKNVFPKNQGNGLYKKNFIVPTTVAIVGFIIFILIITSLFSSGESRLAITSEILAQPELNIAITESGIASIGGFADNKRIAYYKLNYSAFDADSLVISTATYTTHIPNQIFLLTSKMEDASIYPQFKLLLKKQLASKNLVMNEISLEQINTLPSGALLIIPSGRIPEKMVQPGGANLLNLLQRGVNIIYIGQGFEDYSIAENGILTTIPPNSSIKKVFSFKETSMSSDGNLSINPSLYRVFQSDLESNLLYGIISSCTVSNGTILFVPQTLDSGWNKNGIKNAILAAQDIEKIISEMKWMLPESEIVINTTLKKNTSAYSFFLSTPFTESKKNIIIRITAANAKNKTEKLIMVYPRANVKGGLFYLTNILKIDLGTIANENIKFRIKFNETNISKRNLFFSITDVYGKEMQPNYSISSGPGDDGELQGNQFSVRLNLDKGIYLASIVDNVGNNYAQSILDISDVIFKEVSANYEQGRFNFSAYANNQIVPIKKLSIIVDGKYKFAYSDAFVFEVDLRNYTGGVFSAGNHTFEFEFNNIKKQIILTKVVPPPQFYENPFYLIGGALILIIVLVAPSLAALMQKTEYSLDIPDFPPLTSMKIPIKRDSVLNIFEKVNEDYRWKNTPLTLDEIKKGFRKIIYQNKPIFISDYNLEYILEELQNKGYTKSALEYYGLVKWEADSGKNIIQLAIHRKIRDICINDAIPFSKLGESPDYDINLKVLGQDIFVYIMDSPKKREEKLVLALKMMQKGIAVLLFENWEAKKNFEDTINSASETSGLIKLEIMAGSLTPLTINELKKMLKEMKGI